MHDSLGELEVLEGGAILDKVDTLARIPGDAHAMFVLAHGAGAGMRHSFLQSVAERLAERGVATLRYQFPYVQHGKKRPDPPKLLLATVRAAVAEAARLAPDLPLFAGGKSMGGRMTSKAHAHRPLEGIRGLAFLGFPLHPPKQPGTARAAHLFEIAKGTAGARAMLFVQGTRDDLAELALIERVTSSLGEAATVHVIEGGNHSFAVPKRTGRTDLEVLDEIADVVAAWTRRIVAACAGDFRLGEAARMT